MRTPFKLYRDPIPALRLVQDVNGVLTEMKVGERVYAPLDTSIHPNALACLAARWAERSRNKRKFLVCVAGGMVRVYRVL